jgi:CRP/FNR family transcriptional regulator, cyclic AMP receptor protein
MAVVRFHKDARITQLRNISLFSGCAWGDRRRIVSLQSQYEAKKSNVLIQLGMPGDECFVIVKGSATGSRNGIQLAHLGPGEFFGELAPLEGGPRTATVVADTDMLLLVISRREFVQLRMSFPSVSENLLAEMGARLRRADEVLDGTRSVETVTVQAS